MIFKIFFVTLQELHFRVTEGSSLGEHIEAIKADLKAMDSEKEQLTRRIEKIQGKVKNIPNIEKSAVYV